ncbi:MAG: adenine-specific DNA-methyltransferase [Plesiomonas sp.]|uniref:adenine-specific DNA-methyltransferase n=1 Tax=Plesiomonas sp. TaxID=2486279 RepID=UPI003EE558C5
MKKYRAFLKWAGGKYSLVDEIRRHLPSGQRLIEPFVGAGSVFLNTDFDEYLLADINSDLINLYNLVKQDVERFIIDARVLFTPEYNNALAYYALREEFNRTVDPYRRAVIFLYMNRHGFNGLCRYNLKGGFNVPFGSYKKPYFPEDELRYFAEKAKRATFVCESYTETLARITPTCVVYCDPPYAPLSTTANFTTYHSNGFSLDDQATLAELADRAAAIHRIPVLISNHDTALTRRLYQGAKLNVVQVKRTISRNGGSRNKVDELLALFLPAKLKYKR